MISFLLSVILVLNSIQIPVSAAEDTHVEELRFYHDCTKDEYKVISEGSGHFLTFNQEGNPYKFAVKMNEPECLRD